MPFIEQTYKCPTCKITCDTCNPTCCELGFLCPSLDSDTGECDEDNLCISCAGGYTDAEAQLFERHQEGTGS